MLECDIHLFPISRETWCVYCIRFLENRAGPFGSFYDERLKNWSAGWWPTVGAG